MKSDTLEFHTVRATSAAGVVRTGMRMEPEFWLALETAAARRGIRRNALIIDITAEAPSRQITAAVRVWLLQHANEAQP